MFAQEVDKGFPKEPNVLQRQVPRPRVTPMYAVQESALRKALAVRQVAACGVPTPGYALKPLVGLAGGHHSVLDLESLKTPQPTLGTAPMSAQTVSLLAPSGNLARIFHELKLPPHKVRSASVLPPGEVRPVEEQASAPKALASEAVRAVMHGEGAGLEELLRPSQRRKGAQGRPLASSHDERQGALARERAEALAEVFEVLPPAALSKLWEDGLGLAQVPSPDVRKAHLVAGFLRKGGPAGENNEKARRALRELIDYGTRNFIPLERLFPVSELLLGAILREVDQAARGRAAGSLSGRSVAASVRQGFVLLGEHYKLPITVDSVFVEGSAPRAISHSPRHAGSYPIGVQCHMEVIASSEDDTPLRFYARSFCIAMGVSIRAVDALRATIRADPVGNPAVISGITSFSKDGAAFHFYGPAEGFLGPFAWYADHLRALSGKRFIFPDFAIKRQKGVRGVHVGRASSLNMEAVASKDHLLNSFKHILSLPPLSMSEEEQQQLAIRGHSWHTTPSDIAATMGMASPFASFSKDEVRELGNWLRYVEKGSKKSPGSARPIEHGVPQGDRAENGAMHVLYVSGDTRAGSRSAQIAVRSKLAKGVQAAMLSFKGLWMSLPRGVHDKYDFLVVQEDITAAIA